MTVPYIFFSSVSLLHPPEVIDQTYDTRRELSIALAAQWFGVHIVQKVWSDIWLIASLAHHMASIFLRKHLGNNEYRLRLKKDMLRCVSMDVNRPPIFNSMLPAPLDQDDLDFITLKGPLVLYILDRRMTKAGSTRGLSRVIPKILVEAMSGELTLNALSTHWFLRQCRKVSGYDTKTFAEQWIYGSGCPKFTFKYHFNRKKMVVEIDMTQENSSATSAPPAEAITDVNNTLAFQDTVTTIFTGNFIARIHEADGTPYEHILDIQTSAKRFEVQFNTKYKRIRRNTKRFQAKQAAAAAAAAEEEQLEGEEGEQVSSIVPSLGLGMPLFEEDQYRQEWRLVEWGQEEDDTSGAASATFDWIRLDAEFEWICTIKFEQPDYMWAAQLTKDWDVVAQYEVSGMSVCYKKNNVFLATYIFVI
jgi:transcription initiation factor TFIID subunit 2